MPGALDGIVVLDLGQVYNGPYCSLLLAYLGADVIKIEPPQGDSLRRRAEDRMAYPFLMLNSLKRGMQLDLKRPEGVSILIDLVKKADVVVENFATGVADRLGIGYAVLSEVNPRLIFASGKGFGSQGPYRDIPAMDLTVQAMTGIISATGFSGSPPVKAGVAVADFLGGTHLLAAVLAALYQRERTGRGQMVEVSMQDAVLPSLASNIGGYIESRGEVPARTGNRHGGLATCPYNVYRTQDGWIAIIAASERHWLALCGLMGLDSFRADDSLLKIGQRVRRMEEIDAAIEHWTSARSSSECMRLLVAEHVAAAPVLTVGEIMVDRHVRERGMLIDLQHPSMGPVTVFGSPLRMAESPLPEPRPAPSLGQDTDLILTELLAMGSEEIQKLHEDGVL